MKDDMTHEDKMEFYAKQTMNKTKDVAGWVMFFGIVTIVVLTFSIIGTLFIFK